MSDVNTGLLSVRQASTFHERLTGLLGRRALAVGEVLWLHRCRGVHTWGMRFPIDVVFLSERRRLLRIDRDVRPWRMRWCLSAHSVIEMASGEAERLGLRIGQRWPEAPRA